MSRNGVCTSRVDPIFRSDAELKALNPQIVILQRQSDEGQVAEIDRYKEALPKAWFNFEIDDNLSAVPAKSWHSPYMTPNIDARIRNAVKRCHVVTVSTEDLAVHMASVCEPGTKIRVVPNEIGRDDIERCLNTRRAAPPSTSSKLRVGWGGGIGHIGDLEMLNPVFSELKDEVEWFFLGMNPETPEGITKTFMGAATVQDYLVAMAAMNLDLMIAPLEDNLFNRCKSNLRLIEGGACFFPTIASPVAPYLTNSPPVYAYAKDNAEWVEQIRTFAKLPESDRRKHGERLHDWVLSNYILDDHPDRRLLQWLPEHARTFKPKLKQKGSGLSMVSTGDDLYAQFNTSNDILYVRPGTIIPPDAIARLGAIPDDVVLPLSNDGGPWGFPAITSFTPVDASAVEHINKSALTLDQAPIPLVAASGPVVLLRRSALAAIGMPDVDTLSVEIAILEWSVCAKSRGLSLVLAPNVYVGAQAPYQPQPGEAEMASQRISLRWPQNQFDDTKIKEFRERLELRFHRDNYTVLPPQNRADYPTWVSTGDEPGSKTVEAAGETVSGTTPITYFEYPVDPKEFDCGSEWLFLVPKGATVSPLYEPYLLEIVRNNPNAKIIYGDHDFLVPPLNTRNSPDFKPAFDLHMLLSRDYVTQALCLRADLLTDLTTIDEATLYDKVLDIISDYGRDSIVHCPRVLSHIIPPKPTDLPPAYYESQLTAARNFAEKNNFPGTIDKHDIFIGLRTVSYASATESPRAHIIIPTKDRVDLIAPCVATILKMTTYANYDITIIDNGSTKHDTLDWFEKIKLDPRVQILRIDEAFNFSRLNNLAVAHIDPHRDDVLVFLNDDTRVVSPCWLSELVGGTLLPEVGAVGAKLVYPHGLLQHMGLVVHHELIGNIHKGLALNLPGMGAFAVVSHEATAITGACLAITASNFTVAGKFDETLANNFNDIALCQNLRALGLINLVAVKAELQHMEGATRSSKMTPQVAQQLYLDLQLYKQKMGVKQDNGQFILPPDPYWNPNLQLFNAPVPYPLIGGADMNVFTYPPPKAPWEHPAREKILLVGIDGPVSDALKDGACVYRLEVAGNACRINLPPMQNCGPWDIRDPDKAKDALAQLELDRIVVTNLGESPLQLLDFVTRLNVPVYYKPFNVEAVCPRGTMLVGEKLCDSGYKNNLCKKCLFDHGSPQGNPSTLSWHLAWTDFFNRCVEIDLSLLSVVPQFVDGVNYVFGSEEPDKAHSNGGAKVRPELTVVASNPEHFRAVGDSPPPCDLE